MPLEDKQNKKGYYYSLGRSLPRVPADAYGDYTGSVGDWARPSGLASQQVEYLCGEASNSGSNFVEGEYLCEVTLPATSKRNAKDPTKTDYVNLPYFLTYYERSTTVRNEISRFLQKNTFGPTAAELDDLEAKFLELQSGGGSGDGNSSTTAMELSHAEAMTKLQLNWVVSQMDPSNFASGEFSSLRKYWRRRLNPRKEETYRIGESGPHPCEKHSRWRKFAFTNADVQNSKMLRWGALNIGGSYQTQKGHRITVKTVTYVRPSIAPSLAPNSGVPTIASSTLPPDSASGSSRELEVTSTSSAPTSVRFTMLRIHAMSLHLTICSNHLNPTPLFVLLHFQSLSSASTARNILVLGDMEGSRDQVLAQFLGTCTRTLMNATENPSLVYSGSASLKFWGGRTCFFYRPISPACSTGRISEPIIAGDTFKVSLKIRVEADDQVFQMYTGHYHQEKGDLKWTLPVDDSHMISRTLIALKNEWVTIEAVHKVGDDWTYRGNLLEPEQCNHYHLRFRIADSGASFFVDDVRVSKISSGSSESTGNTTFTDVSVPTTGFFTNPNFDYSYQYWMYSSTAATLRKDPDLNRDVMVMKRGSVLTQNIRKNVIPGKSYRFSFLTKIENIDSVDMVIVIRVKLNNNDLINGPCNKVVCNFWARPLNRKIDRLDGGWQEVVTDSFRIDNFTEWNGSVDLVTFQMTAKNMSASGEFSIAGFQDLGDTYTDAPSTSTAPSSAPTNLEEEEIAYIVSYAGEVRTVIKYPFQIDSTGVVLDMNGTKEFQLCEVDEVEGRKAEVSDNLKTSLIRILQLPGLLLLCTLLLSSQNSSLTE